MNISNLSENFQIQVTVYPENKIHRLAVNHFYTSPQAERFKIHGRNNRFIILEKRVEGRKQSWKMIEGTITAANLEQTSVVIRNIQDALETYLKKRKQALFGKGY